MPKEAKDNRLRRARKIAAVELLSELGVLNTTEKLNARIPDRLEAKKAILGKTQSSRCLA